MRLNINQRRDLQLVVWTAVVVGFATFGAGYLARDLRPVYFPRTSTQMRVYVGPQPDGTMSLQINMNGRALGWIALSPDTKEYLRAKLAELP